MLEWPSYFVSNNYHQDASCSQSQVQFSMGLADVVSSSLAKKEVDGSEMLGAGGTELLPAGCVALSSVQQTRTRYDLYMAREKTSKVGTRLLQSQG